MRPGNIELFIKAQAFLHVLRLILHQTLKRRKEKPERLPCISLSFSSLELPLFGIPYQTISASVRGDADVVLQGELSSQNPPIATQTATETRFCWN